MTVVNPGGGGGGSTIIGTALSSQTYLDLCGPGWTQSPGGDISSALQAALSQQIAANTDTTIEFTKITPGTPYLLNGALQSGSSGTTPNRAYSGQIVLPARDFASSGPLTIRILGPSPPPAFIAERATEAFPAGGLVIQSNMSTLNGWIIDAIASTGTNNPNNPNTDIRLILENVILIAPTDPQGGGVNGFQLASLRLINSFVISGSLGGATLTGSGIGVQFPPYQNMAGIGMEGRCQVGGFPNNIAHSEHFTADDVYFKNSTVGVLVQGQGASGHATKYKRLLFGGCKTCIKAGPSGGNINGLIDFGDSAGGFLIANVIDDATNLLAGELRVVQWKEAETGPLGFPVNGGLNVRLEPEMGRNTPYPEDTFQRLPAAQVTTQAYIGATDKTHHVWRYTAGVSTGWTTASNNLKAATATNQQAVIAAPYGRPSASRVVHAVVQPNGGSYNASVVVGYVIAGAKAGHFMVANLTGGQILLKKNTGSATTLATSSAGIIVAGTTYMIDVLVNNPVGGPYVVTVCVNGTPIALTLTSGTGTIIAGPGGVGNSYQLAAVDITDLAEGDPDLTGDGLGIFNETGSIFTSYSVGPL